jgi:hypothetical protein
MNRDSVPYRIDLTYPSNYEVVVGTIVPPNPFSFTDKLFRGLKLTELAGKPCGVVMHPSAWRGVKRIMLKNRAKRRARVRMRSRGYVAHGRHGRRR